MELFQTNNIYFHKISYNSIHIPIRNKDTIAVAARCMKLVCYKINKLKYQSLLLLR